MPPFSEKHNIGIINNYLISLIPLHAPFRWYLSLRIAQPKFDRKMPLIITLYKDNQPRQRKFNHHSGSNKTPYYSTIL
jgi:hypothetical protein